MFVMEIGCHAVIHKILFETAAQAQEQLDLLKPKMGSDYDRIRRNGTEDITHTIKSPEGDVVVVLSKIETARVIDMEKYMRFSEPFDDFVIDREVKKAKAIANATASA